MEKDIRIISLIKKDEKYFFLYDANNTAELFRLWSRYASNPELSFTWYDAAVLSQKIRHDRLQERQAIQKG